MEPEQKSNGALVGLIVIITILILGGVYLWNQNQKNNSELEKKISETSTSDENTTEMQANLNSVDLENLDSAI